ncbi:hypothetical protein K2X33_06770 [bacterium]|nr:hypothetical protein [bacterium]
MKILSPKRSAIFALLLAQALGSLEANCAIGRKEATELLALSEQWSPAILPSLETVENNVEIVIAASELLDIDPLDYENMERGQGIYFERLKPRLTPFLNLSIPAQRLLLRVAMEGRIFVENDEKVYSGPELFSYLQDVPQLSWVTVNETLAFIDESLPARPPLYRSLAELLYFASLPTEPSDYEEPFRLASVTLLAGILKKPKLAQNKNSRDALNINLGLGHLTRLPFAPAGASKGRLVTGGVILTANNFVNVLTLLGSDNAEVRTNTMHSINWGLCMDVGPGFCEGGMELALDLLKTSPYWKIRRLAAMLLARGPTPQKTWNQTLRAALNDTKSEFTFQAVRRSLQDSVPSLTKGSFSAFTRALQSDVSLPAGKRSLKLLELYADRGMLLPEHVSALRRIASLSDTEQERCLTGILLQNEKERGSDEPEL